MSLKQKQQRFNLSSRNHSQQTGSILPVAIFIIVVMSVLGITMTRIVSEAGRATVADIYNTRAEAAANSGVEIMLTQIFPLDAPVNASCDARGSTVARTTINFSSGGLTNCHAEIGCDQLELPHPYTGYNFRVFSTGICVVGNQVFSRQVLLEATDDTL